MLYYIQNGVRRALAAREAGQQTVRARIYLSGKRPVLRRLNLEDLRSPKWKVKTDARFLRIEPPIHEPIEVEPFGEIGQSRSVPLSEVELY